LNRSVFRCLFAHETKAELGCTGAHLLNFVILNQPASRTVNFFYESAILLFSCAINATDKGIFDVQEADVGRSSFCGYHRLFKLEVSNP
jgi:hypothetical protein